MSFTSLPTELAQEVLQYLPVRSLNAFALTSRAGYVLARSSLRALDLGIFHSRVNSFISRLDSPGYGSSAQLVCMTLSKAESKTRHQTVRNQNAKAARVLRQHGHSLRSLDLAMWELEKPLADFFVDLKNLRYLSLRFDHEYVRHPSLGRDYWDRAPTGSVWDLLSTSCGGEGVFGRLKSLALERSGIIDYQLECIIERNPTIRELKLRKCLALTYEFFDYLARSPVASTLTTLHVTRNDSDEMDERMLAYIPALGALEHFSLYGCKNFDSEKIQALNDKEWHIRDMTLPYSPSSPPNMAIEVDPEYK